MEIDHSIQKNPLGVLVEGPRWGDAEFYGNWLLAAAKAEAFGKKPTASLISKERLIG